RPLRAFRAARPVTPRSSASHDGASSTSSCPKRLGAATEHAARADRESCSFTSEPRRRLNLALRQGQTTSAVVGSGRRWFGQPNGRATFRGGPRLRGSVLGWSSMVVVGAQPDGDAELLESV